MNDRARFKIYTIVRPASLAGSGECFVAYGKFEPFVLPPDHQFLGLCEPGELWFDYGDTKQSAVRHLKDGMLSYAPG